MWQINDNDDDKEMLIPDYSLFDFGYFVTADKKIGRWHLSGGARIDNRRLSAKEAMEEEELKFCHLTKNFTGITGSLGAIYNVNDNLNLRLNVARGFRAPTVSELASNGVQGKIRTEKE